MGNIVLLDDLTINKIAAGEVIERPSSVVKELLENSIDAGAKNITIEIKNGGISLIKISDDGVGIAKDDMEIAFERHATSKIRKAEDLASVTTMGFRGEALASIAAISKVEMVSKKADSEVGNKIVVEGGKTLEFKESARAVGTTITVQNLFYNTPVRYKFLKKDYTEAGYIEDVVTRMALVNLDVAIKLISNDKTIIQTNGTGDLKTTIYSIYGKDISLEVKEVNYEYEEINVMGVVGNPVIARSNRSNQLFFLNGRYIKDKNLTAAADQAFKGIVPVGRYGFLILNLQMDPKAVDVNVHPTKLEVRFEDESKAFKAVYHAIKSTLTTVDDENNTPKFDFNSIAEQKWQETMELPKINTKIDNKVTEVAENVVPQKVSYSDVNKSFITDTENTTKKKQGIVGLFQKIIGEPEETEEEKNNNYLEDIYNKNNLISKSILSDENFEQKEDLVGNSISKIVNNSADDIIDNEISNLSNYSVGIDNTLKDNIIKENMEYVETNINKNEYKVVEENIENSDNEVSEPVNYNNIINSTTKESDNILIDETINSELAKNILNSYAEKNEKEIPQEELPKVEEMQEELPKMEEKMPEEKTDNSNESFEAIAEKLINSNLCLDTTQMIDTTKVRKALKEDDEVNENSSPKAQEISEENSPEFEEMYKKTFGVEPFSIRKEKKLEKEKKEREKEKDNFTEEFSFANASTFNVFDDNEETVNIPYKYIGIAFNTYIIIEVKNDLYIINKNLANERLIYERIKENYYSEENKDEQELLLPDVISLSEKDMFIAKENSRMFKKAGFSFSAFGENTIKLETVPSICEKINTKQLFIDIINEIRNVAVNDKKEKEEKFIYTIANKVSQKTNVNLDDEDAIDLVNDLLSIQNPFLNSKNDNIAIKVTKYDLERKFSRK